MTTTTPHANQIFAEALVEGLVGGGVSDLCLCPGSRSTPVVAAAVSAAGLRLWSHLDERAAAYFALGLAKARRAPVALLCTSGTAAANFLPAVAEAWHARVPLVVLTADRPPELRGWGAGQTLDQLKLFGSHVRWFAEAPPPEGATPGARYARALSSRAVAVARGRPAGPVHLNLPFREPLEPAPTHEPTTRREGTELRERQTVPIVHLAGAPPEPDSACMERLLEPVRAARRGVVACGPLDAEPAFAEAAVRLARAAGWPLFADALSGLRGGPHTKEAPLVTRFDALLRDERFAAGHAPDLVMRFGEPPTSKAWRLWLERHPEARLVVVDPEGSGVDPSHLATDVVGADPTTLARALAEALERSGPRGEPSWQRAFLDGERAARAIFESPGSETEPLLEPRLVREIAGALPDGATLYVSNSMPVRDVESFLPVSTRRLRVLGQRGVNGIDGIVSAALGASAGIAGPMVCLIGDLALLHDLGGLLAARRHDLRVTFVVVNNDGGGIFSYLPAARLGARVAFTEQFITPHGLALRSAAQLFGLGYERARTVAELRPALTSALGAPRSTLLEVPVEREASVAEHRALWRRVGEALHTQARVS